MDNPKVSVIVPIYKVEKYLMQCLDSIRVQTLTDIEIIMVDEGDWDACYAVMLMYAAADSRFKIIHEKSGGYGASVNLGIDAARAEYLSIVESDDFIEPTMLEEMYRVAKDLDVDVLKAPYYNYFDRNIYGPSRKYLCDYAEKVTKQSPQGAFHILEYPQQMAVHASVWSGLYRASLFSDKGVKFVEAKGAAYVDVLFRIQTFVEAERVAWLPTPFYNYRCTNEESSTNKFNLDAMLRRWEEAHDYFEAMSSEIYKTVGPYLFLDEYLNTIGWLPHLKCSEEQYQRMRANLARVDPAIVDRSPVLDRRQKAHVMQVRQSPTLKDYMKGEMRVVGRGLRDTVYRCLHSEVLIQHNRLRIHLLAGLRRKVVRLNFKALDRFAFEFLIGA